ncbi:MAG: hypothetical protein ACLTZY_07470 [Alistipes indistinctus]
MGLRPIHSNYFPTWPTGRPIRTALCQFAVCSPCAYGYHDQICAASFPSMTRTVHLTKKVIEDFF